MGKRAERFCAVGCASSGSGVQPLLVRACGFVVMLGVFVMVCFLVCVMSFLCLMRS